VAGAVKLTPELIEGLAKSVFSESFDEPAPTPDCHREWWKLCTSNHPRIAIAAPRAHAKSTSLTKIYTSAELLFRCSDYVVLVSDTYRQACMFLAEIKREFVENLTLKELFDVSEELVVDREEEFIVRFKDGHLARVVAVGSEQKLRGFLWRGKRPNLVMCDDMENDEMVQNPERREKFRNWFLNALLPLMSERGKIRIVGTILHTDALLERFMPRETSLVTVRTNLASYTAKPINGWMSARYAAHGPDGAYDEILWPVKWTERRLKEIQSVFNGQGNPEGYYQEYLNKPIDPRNAYFRKSDFTEYSVHDSERPFENYNHYLSVDLAVSVKQRRDWCVFGIGALDEDGMFYLRHVVRERLDSKDIVETVVRLQEKYKFNTMLIGKGALEKAIGPFLKEQMALNNRFLHLETIPENLDKRQRAQSIRARMRVGGVKFDKDQEWYPEFEQELLRFDRDVHDDQVDMMALFGMYLDRLQYARTPKELLEEEYEEEHSTFLQGGGDLNQGRSLVTGY
jgi:predicted phage terminase large subunit-like protein